MTGPYWGLLIASSNGIGQLEFLVYDALDPATNTTDANGVTITSSSEQAF